MKVMKVRDTITPWPVVRPVEYLSILNEPQSGKEERVIESSMEKGKPFGEDIWLYRIVKKFGLASTLPY